jgi:hypothetical protein
MPAVSADLNRDKKCRLEAGDTTLNDPFPIREILPNS